MGGRLYRYPGLGFGDHGMTAQGEDDEHPYWYVNADEYVIMRALARALNLEHACGYNAADDRMWMRITHGDMHVLVRTPGMIDGMLA